MYVAAVVLLTPGPAAVVISLPDAAPLMYVVHNAPPADSAPTTTYLFADAGVIPTARLLLSAADESNRARNSFALAGTTNVKPPAAPSGATSSNRRAVASTVIERVTAYIVVLAIAGKPDAHASVSFVPSSVIDGWPPNAASIALYAGRFAAVPWVKCRPLPDESPRVATAPETMDVEGLLRSPKNWRPSTMGGRSPRPRRMADHRAARLIRSPQRTRRRPCTSTRCSRPSTSIRRARAMRTHH